MGGGTTPPLSRGTRDWRLEVRGGWLWALGSGYDTNKPPVGERLHPLPSAPGSVIASSARAERGVAIRRADFGLSTLDFGYGTPPKAGL